MTKQQWQVWLGLTITVAVLMLLYFFPWHEINWGNISVMPSKTVTVTGSATTQQTNEVARYTAGVNAVNDSKDKAVSDVNEKVTALVASLKSFGINDKDIKTQNLNIYQNQEQYYEDGRQKQRLGQWNVSNSIEVTLREVVRAQALTDLLSQSGANNVYGPNFGLDETKSEDAALVTQAIDNARQKAEAMAQASGAKLGSVLQVTEGQYSGPIMPYLKEQSMGGGGGTPVETGSTSVTKVVTVTYELK